MKKKLLFMGDSLTAGVYSDGKLQYDRINYPMMIATMLKNRKMLDSYYNIAVSGFSTSDVYNQVNHNLSYNENIAFNIVGEHCYKKGLKNHHHSVKLLEHDIKIVDLIKDSDEIIMTLGSNDFIKFFDRYREQLGDIIQSTSDDNLFERTTNEVVKNYLRLFNLILAINPQVEIVLLGSYVPNKSQAIQNTFYDLFHKLEKTISNQLLDTYPNLQYITVMAGFKEYSERFLDNPVNIHPNKLGYAYYAKRYEVERLNKE